jgi:hypothetical protein
VSTVLRDEIRAAWPDRALTHGRKVPVPPVRDGGNTAACIDLAVELAAKHAAADTAKLQKVTEMRDRGQIVLEGLAALHPQTEYVEGSAKAVKQMVEGLSTILGTQPPTKFARVRSVVAKQLRCRSYDNGVEPELFDELLDDIATAVLNFEVTKL